MTGKRAANRYRETIVVTALFALLFLPFTRTFADQSDTAAGQSDTDDRVRAERMLSSILRAAPTGIGVVENRVFTDVNDYIVELTGYSREELIGKNARMIYPSDAEYEFVGREKYRQISERGTGTVETVWQKKDGALLSVILSSTPLDPDDLAAGVVFTVLDITERKRDAAALAGRTRWFLTAMAIFLALQLLLIVVLIRNLALRKRSEAALRGKTEELDRYFSSALDLLCIADVQGNFIRVNRQWEHTLGYGVADLEGGKFLDLVHPDDMPDTLAAMARLGKQEEVLNFTNRYRCKDGSYRNIEWRSTPHGELIYAAARDVTERRLVEENLRYRFRLERMFSEITGSLANARDIAIDAALSSALETIARFSNASRCSLFLLAEDREHVTNTHEWCATPDDSQIRLLQNTPLALFGYYREKLLRFETTTISSVKDLPPEATGELAWIEKHGFRPLLFVPLVKQGQLEGALGLYGAVGEERGWPAEFVEMLKTSGNIFVNVIDRKRAEGDLRESEAKLSALFASMTEIVVLHEIVLDEHGRPVNYRITDCNDAFTRATGIAKDAAMGRLATEVYGVDAPPYIEIYAPVATTGRPDFFEAYFAPMDRHFLISVVAPEKNKFATVTTDITDIKRAEEALRRSEENLRVTLDSIGDAVIATDTDGRIVRMNPVAELLTGWSAGDAAGRPLAEVFRIVNAASRAEVENPVAMVLASGKIVGLANHTVLIAKNGREYQIADSGAPIRSQTGVTIGVVLVFRDVTEEYALQEQLRQSQKLDAIGQLAGGVAHDFNNMLGGIMGGAELLKLRLPDDEKCTEYFDIIMKSAERAADMSGKLLAFARRQASGSTPVDVHRAVEDAVAILKNTIDKRIEIELDLTAEASAVIGNGSHLQSVFLNLGINAAHAMPSGGRLSFRSKVAELSTAYCAASTFDLTPGKYVEIEVRDTGCGIRPEDLPRIFEPFFTTKETGKGTGLGLAAVYGTVKQHRGAITAYSESGKGACFRLVFPLTEKAAAALPPAGAAVHGKGLVLVVDDEAVMRATGGALLEEYGYDVLLAENGRAALDIYRERHAEIDLVILDMVMPVMSGHDCFLEMKKIRPDARIVLSSGFTRNEDLSELRAAGLRGFIQKPFHGIEFSRVVAEAMRTDRAPDGFASDAR